MIASVLVRNEAIKALKRLAFWVTVGGYAFITIMQFGSEARRAAEDPLDDRYFALPGAWSDILGEYTQAGLFFASVLIILLIASEFSWRTARQNVIDGLSKSEFFSAKAFVIPAVAAVFIVIQVGAGTTFALLGDRPADAVGPLMAGAQWSAIAGIGLAYLGYGGVALLIATSVRAAGPAIGMWFFYIAIIEQLIIGLLSQIGDRVAGVLRFAPINVFNRLYVYLQHDAAAYQRAVDAALERGRDAPQVWDNGVLFGAASVWIVVLFAGSYFLFRKRDL